MKDSFTKILSSYIGVTFLVTAPLFVIMLFFTNNVLLSFLVFIFLFLFVYLGNKLDNNFGIKRHNAIIKSKGFQELLSKGFKTERINDYIGITGTYKGYVCDIYYDWMTFIKSGTGKACVINIYFMPQKPFHEIHNANYNFMVKMRKAHAISRWSFKSHDVDWQEGAITLKQRIGFKDPSCEKIEKTMHTAIAILKEENLKPISRQGLNTIRANFPHQSVPQISLYHENKE